MRALINYMATRTDSDHKHGHMLARNLTELYEHIRDYTVLVDEDDNVQGCCALQSTWEGLAEVKALAVSDKYQGHGYGRQLVEAVLAEQEELGVECVFTLTNKMGFFLHLGFVPIDMRELPHRVWNECVRCPKFMIACDEVAMTYKGVRPKKTYIPPVGSEAPSAAIEALKQQGVKFPKNSENSPY